MASLEDQIRTLMESRKTKKADTQADRVDDEPAVKIENPMDPNLTSSELTPEQDESEEAEGTTGGDANVREKTSKKKAEKERATMKEDAQQNFDAALAASQVDATGDRHEDQFAATQSVQNTTNVDPSNADAEERFEDEKEKADAQREAIPVPDVLGDLLGQEFSEDFKLKAKTVFEAAVKDQVSSHMNKLDAECADTKKKLEEEFAAKSVALQQEFQEKYSAHTKQLEEETSEKIDGYLTYVAEEWTTKNELALEAGIKTELTESFINKLKTLCEDHYIDMPEGKVDLYKTSLDEKVELETSLAEAIAKLQALKEEFNTTKRANIIEESSKDFSSLDASRFKTLVEDFDFEDEDTFRKKVGIVKKSFFDNKQSGAKEHLAEEIVKTEPIVDQGSSTIEPVLGNTRMSAYLNALKQ